MRIFDKFKTLTAIDRLSEEKLYEQVAQELQAGKKREGIWVKAMAKSGGDLNKAESMYIEYRVQSLSDEAQVLNNEKKAILSKNKLAITEKLCRQILEKKGYTLQHPMFAGYIVLHTWTTYYEGRYLKDLHTWAINAEDLS